MTRFCMLPENVPFDVTSERLMFWYALASYRRQLCHESQTGGYNPPKEIDAGAIDVAYNYVV